MVMIACDWLACRNRSMMRWSVRAAHSGATCRSTRKRCQRVSATVAEPGRRRTRR